MSAEILDISREAEGRLRCPGPFLIHSSLEKLNAKLKGNI